MLGIGNVFSDDQKRPDHPPYCLKHAALFTGIDEELLEVFSEAAQSRYYKKGKILYVENDMAELFYVACSGWVKLFHTLPGGEEVIIDILTEGQIVGEDSMFEHNRYTSSAQVVEDMHVLSFPTKLLQEQIAIHPQLGVSMISSMSRHYRQHSNQIALNMMLKTPQRIGCFLLRLCPPNKTHDIVFQLPYDKNLIAYTLGMNVATFSRALNVLRQNIDIRLSGNSVEIDSVEQLRTFVYGPHALSYTPK